MKKTQRFLSFTLVLIMVLTLFPAASIATANNDIVPSNAIRIQTEEDLRNILSGEASVGLHYVLMNDIELTSPHSIFDFRGIFDGQGYTLHNSQGSLFPSTNGAAVMNITVIGEGGLIGTAINTDVTNAHFIGNVSASAAGKWLNQQRHAGGLISDFEVTDGSTYRIDRCSAIGDVMAYGGNGGWARAGGLIGTINTGNGRVIIADSFSHGNVTAETWVGGTWSGLVASAAQAGGLVGFIWADEYSGVTVFNSYSIGDVSTPGNGSNYIGALLSRDEDVSVVNSYRLANQILTYEHREPREDINGFFYPPAEICVAGAPLTQEQMREQTSFMGWNFDEVWAIDPNINDGYPHLQIRLSEVSRLSALITHLAGEFIRENCDYLYSPIIDDKIYYKYVSPQSKVVYSSDEGFSFEITEGLDVYYLLDSEYNLVDDSVTLKKAMFLLNTNNYYLKNSDVYDFSTLAIESNHLKNSVSVIDNIRKKYHDGSFLIEADSLALDTILALATLPAGAVLFIGIHTIKNISSAWESSYQTKIRTEDMLKIWREQAWEYTESVYSAALNIANDISNEKLRDALDMGGNIRTENGYLRSYDDAVTLLDAKFMYDIYMEYWTLEIKYIANKAKGVRRQTILDLAGTAITGHLGPNFNNFHLDTITEFVELTLVTVEGVSRVDIARRNNDTIDPDLQRTIDNINRLLKDFRINISPIYDYHFGNKKLVNYAVDDELYNRGIIMNCPIDVKVYDENNNLIGQIVNNVVDISIDFAPDNPIAIMLDGEAKILFFPYAKNYRIEIIATDFGVMSYLEWHIDGNNNVISSTNIQNILLDSETSYTVNSDNLTENADYTRLYNEEGIVSFSVVANLSGNGNVLGDGTYFLDDIVYLLAIPDENYSFKGWYENDIKVSDTGVSYSFVATSDRRLEARFIPNSDETGSTDSSIWNLTFMIIIIAVLLVAGIATSCFIVKRIKNRK